MNEHIHNTINPFFNRVCKDVPHPLIIFDEKYLKKFQNNIILLQEMKEVKTENKNNKHVYYNKIHTDINMKNITSINDEKVTNIMLSKIKHNIIIIATATNNISKYKMNQCIFFLLSKQNQTNIKREDSFVILGCFF